MFIKTGKMDENRLACITSLRECDNFFFSSFPVGKSRSSSGGNRYYSEIGSKKFFAPICSVCYVLWMAEAYSRRSQYRVKLFVVLAFTILQ